MNWGKWAEGIEALELHVPPQNKVQELFICSLRERDAGLACPCWILNVFLKEPAHQNWCLHHKETLPAMGDDPYRCNWSH